MNSKPVDREDVLLAGLDLPSARGLEIGPLNRAVVPRPPANVEYLDHLDTAGLRAKYKNDPNVTVEDIVDVDHVNDGRRLAEIVGPERHYDYVVACHVIEHVPNVLGWLEQIEEILAPGGTLRLAIPDRRFTFDYLRRESELVDVLTAQILDSTRPSTIQIVDFVLNTQEVPADRAWAGTVETVELDPALLGASRAVALDSHENGVYHDVHCWVFTPVSFAQLMSQCATLGLVGFGVQSFVHTQPGTVEFYVVAAPMSPEDATKSWDQMAEECATIGLEIPDQRSEAARVAALEDEVRVLRGNQQIIQSSGSYRLARQVARPVRMARATAPQMRRRLRALRGSAR